MSASIFADTSDETHFFDLPLHELVNLNVTATKRETNARETPISISAFSGDELKDRGIISLNDLNGITASFQAFSSDDTVSRPIMRGIYGSGAGFQGSPSVAFYMDDTTLTSSARSQGEFLLADIERVEILKGPQGTLFGDGSLAGTVRIITNKPDLSTFSTEVKTGLNQIKGGDSGGQVQAIVNAPLIDETLGLRLVTSYREHGGWLENAQRNKHDVNSLDDSQTRLALRYQPLFNLTLDVHYMHQDIENPNDHSSPTLGEKSSTLDEIETLESDTYGLTLTYIMDRADLVFAASNSSRDDRALSDETAGANTVIGPLFSSVPIASDTSIDVTSYELRLLSNKHQTIEWTTGLFYKKIDRKLEQFTNETPALDTALGNPALAGRHLVNALLTYYVEQQSVFGELTWHINSDYELIFGGQYFKEKRKGKASDNGIIAPVTFNNLEESVANEHFSPRLVGALKASSNAYYFASISQGFRAGGVNSIAQVVNSVTPGLAAPEVEPETLTAFEIGAKYTFDNFTADISFYRQHWEDTQQTLNSPSLIVYLENTGEVVTTGLELDVLYQYDKQLSFTISSALTDSEYDKDVRDNTGNIIIENGNKVEHIPELALSLSTEYKFKLHDLNSLVRLDYLYRDETYSDAENSKELKTDKYHALNFRFGIEEKNWEAFFYVKNLLDKENIVSKRNSSIGIVETQSYPRFIGVDFYYRF